LFFLRFLELLSKVHCAFPGSEANKVKADPPSSAAEKQQEWQDLVRQGSKIGTQTVEQAKVTMKVGIMQFISRFRSLHACCCSLQ
jgi:hypothetical protein